MQKLILASAALLAIASAPAFAEGPRASSSTYVPQAEQQVEPQRPPHYEWQYGYVGHHPVYRGHWVLVR